MKQTIITSEEIDGIEGCIRRERDSLVHYESGLGAALRTALQRVAFLEASETVWKAEEDLWHAQRAAIIAEAALHDESGACAARLRAAIEKIIADSERAKGATK